MASRSDIERAFQLSGIGHGPSDEEYNFYSNAQWPDAGRVEGDLRHIIDGGSYGGTLNGGSSGGGGTVDFKQYIAPAEKMVNPYYDQLVKDAQGDWNLVQKYIKEDYAYYLGKGDVRMAQFVQSVANTAEERKGVLQFDYDRAKSRLKDDYLTAKKRLAEEDTAFRGEEKYYAGEAKRQRASGYYERLGGTGVIGQAVEQPTEARAEKERQFRLTEHARQMKERREDLLQGKTRGIEDITAETRRKVYAAQLQKSPTGRELETEKKRYEQTAVGKYSDIEKQRQEARQMYINWLGQNQIKNVGAFLA